MEANPVKGKKKALKPKAFFLYYVSLATSSFILTDFLWPGYVDQLSFIFILLMACIPMSCQARLGVIALCMVNHESSAFALIPIILFCFPKRESFKALLIIFLYLVIWFASHGSINQALAVHSGSGSTMSVLQGLFEDYGIALAGVFSSYKLLWFIFLYVVWTLWCQKDKSTLLAVVSMTLFPIFLTAIAWDTTRGVNYGFLGILIAFAILIDDYDKSPRQSHRLVFTSIYANILIPSYPVILSRPASVLTYPYPGLYQLIHSFFLSSPT